MRHPWDIAEYPLGGSTCPPQALGLRRSQRNHQRHEQYQRHALSEAQRIALMERPGLVNWSDRAGSAIRRRAQQLDQVAETLVRINSDRAKQRRFYLASSLGFARQLTGSPQLGFLIFAGLAVVALRGLTSVKTRWRTTWGAAIQNVRI